MQNYEKRTSLLGKAGTVNWTAKQRKLNYDPGCCLSDFKKKLRSELFSEAGFKKDFHIQITLPSYVEIS